MTKSRPAPPGTPALEGDGAGQGRTEVLGCLASGTRHANEGIQQRRHAFIAVLRVGSGTKPHPQAPLLTSGGPGQPSGCPPPRTNSRCGRPEPLDRAGSRPPPLPSFRAALSSTRCSFSQERPATAHGRRGLCSGTTCSRATSWATNWPVKPDAPNTTRWKGLASVAMTSPQRAEARGGRSPPRLRLTQRPQYRAQQLPLPWPPPPPPSPPQPARRAPDVPRAPPRQRPRLLRPGGRCTRKELAAIPDVWRDPAPQNCFPSATAEECSRSQSRWRASGFWGPRPQRPGAPPPSAQGLGDPLHGCHCPAAPWGKTTPRASLPLSCEVREILQRQKK